MNFRSVLTTELLFLAIFGDLDMSKGISNLSTRTMSYYIIKNVLFYPNDFQIES